MAMMRGVNCALASCTTISSDETTKTTKVSIDDVNAPRIVRAPSGVKLNQLQPVARSSQRTSGATTRTRPMASTGMSQSDQRNVRFS